MSEAKSLPQRGVIPESDEDVVCEGCGRVMYEDDQGWSQWTERDATLYGCPSCTQLFDAEAKP